MMLAPSVLRLMVVAALVVMALSPVVLIALLVRDAKSGRLW